MEPVNHQYIRCFDLGGSGLKTALVIYDPTKKSMRIEGSVQQLGKCPDDQKVSDWARKKIQEIAKTDLDQEAKKGYLFGFSLAGLDKLRKKSVSTDDMAQLFDLPKERVAYTGDGNAHLIASLKSVKNLPEGRIWNIALGTGVGFGITNSKKEVKPSGDLKKFFGCEAWEAKELTTNKGIWEAGSGPAFDKIVHNNGNNTSKAIEEFAGRWKLFIEKQIIERSKNEGKEWAAPNAVVFTGGHIEWNDDRLTNALNKAGLKVPAFTGPKQAGVLGAAWLAVENSRKKY